MDTDEQLLRAWRDGRREAGETLLARLRPALAAVCWAVSGNPAIAEEAVQEASFRLVRGLGSFREGAAVRPWALQIARNAVRDLLRRRRPHVSMDGVDEPAGGPAPDAPLLRREKADLVGRLVAELPPALREVVIMKYALELENAEIVETLGIGEEALWARLSRARRLLRERTRDAM